MYAIVRWARDQQGASCTQQRRRALRSGAGRREPAGGDQVARFTRAGAPYFFGPHSQDPAPGRGPEDRDGLLKPIRPPLVTLNQRPATMGPQVDQYERWDASTRAEIGGAVRLLIGDHSERAAVIDMSLYWAGAEKPELARLFEEEVQYRRGASRR